MPIISRRTKVAKVSLAELIVDDKHSAGKSGLFARPDGNRRFDLFRFVRLCRGAGRSAA